MPKLDVDRIKNQTKSFFDGFTTGQKVMTGVALLTLIVGAYLFMKWESKPSYTPLFSNLSSQDASAITDQLKTQGVSYQLTDGGQTILVPQSQVYQLRLDMSKQNLPSGGNEGYTLLDKEGVTTSEFRQRVDYQRALEGELAKTIGAMDPIAGASVHLVIPQQDVFVSDTQKPSASVLIETKGGQELSSEQVQAIVHLTASSVEGLQASDVTVADTKGDVLSATDANGFPVGGGGSNATQTKSFQDSLSAAIQAMLVPVVGTNHSVVRVAADLDFDAKSTTTEKYQNGLGQQAQQASGTTGTTPPAPVPLQNNTSNETYSGPGSSATGVLGLNGAAGTTAGGNVTYNKTDTQQTNALDKITEQVQSAPGSINRLSVSVLVDQKSISQAEVTQLTRAVSAAAGIDTTRGDTIALTRMAFDSKTAKAAAASLTSGEQSAQGNQMMNYAKTGIAALLVGLVLLLAWRSTKKAANRPPVRTPLDLRALEASLGGPLEPELAAALIAGTTTYPLLAGGGDAQPSLVPAVAAVGAPPVEREIAQLIDRQPDEVAATLRSWLADRRG
jgi:flagellar M-ring protein FliF